VRCGIIWARGSYVPLHRWLIFFRSVLNVSPPVAVETGSDISFDSHFHCFVHPLT
jgi:hypothetical protein